jgi:hypothetical protein
MRAVFLSLCGAMLFTACDASDREKANVDEEKRIQCLDRMCEGDIPPAHAAGETVIKLNGQWYAAPTQYQIGQAGFAFYWPSKTPVRGRADSQPLAESGKNYYDVAVEIFLRSHPSSPPSSGMYKLLIELQRQGRVVQHTQVRKGLDAWQVNDKGVSELWYVATDMKDPAGQPAALACRPYPNPDRCTMGFVWQPGVSADVRFDARHALDWPDIYQEVNRVLRDLRRK